jgi:formate-dependent phosphoribosylglycinamide formyltransferase (GAR transformylase)
VGKLVSEIDSSGARMGFVIAQDENAEAAIKDCEQALEKIRVQIK